MGTTSRILIVATNVAEYEKVGYRTGLWLGELTHFWDVASEAGFQLDIASAASHLEIRVCVELGIWENSDNKEVPNVQEVYRAFVGEGTPSAA